jgi:hypothetical protein
MAWFNRSLAAEKRRSGLALFSLILAMSLTGCGDSELSQRPPKSAENATFDTSVSRIGALASLPMQTLGDAANSKIPQQYSDSGNGEEKCGTVALIRYCVGTKYEYTVTRGPISISAANANTIRISVPMNIDGKGGFRGDGAKVLGLNAKNFSAALDIHADVSPTLSDDWCPTLETAIDYNWTKNPRVEIVGGVWVDVKGAVEKPIRDKIPELQDKIRNAVNCADFKKQIEASYGTRSVPVDVPGVGKINVNIEPSDIAFSGLNVTSDAVSAAALLTTKVELSQSPIEAKLLPLPPLKKIDPVAPLMTISVPLRAEYQTITGAMTGAVAGKTFEQDTPAGKVSVKVNGAEVYPSNGHLVVGLDITADLPSSWLDTKGKVYLIAKPNVVDGTKIVLSDIAFSQVLDNDFWKVASVVFQGPILAELNKHAEYDLSGEIAKAKDALVAKLADPTATPGWRVHLDDLDIKIGRIAAADKEFAVEGLFSAKTVIEPVFAQ